MQVITRADLHATAQRLRRHIIDMVYTAQSGHIGGSLSSVEILTALYFGDVLRHNPDDPRWSERDRFILSKAHCVPVLYAALAEAGYFSVNELATFRQLDSRLQGHVKFNLDIGAESSGGSLGQGLSWALGEALAARIDGLDFRVYCLLGDGELDEGQVWEAAMAGGTFKAGNLCAIVDRNGLQNDASTADTQELEPLADKWRAFGWHALELDGHDLTALFAGFAEAERVTDGPTVLICRTTKGKGISYMENQVRWHAGAPTEEEYRQAMAELEGY